MPDNPTPDLPPQGAAGALRDENPPAPPAQLASIIDSAMDGIITIDANQRVVLFNAAAERMFGCAAADAIGRPIEQFIPERFRADHAAHIHSFGHTGVASRPMAKLQPIAGRRADGQEFPVEASISQAEVDGRKLYTVILRDITERHRVEMEIRSLLDEICASREQLQALSRQLMHVQEAERRRLASELHDEVGQALTAIQLNLQALAADSDRPAHVARLEDSMALVEQVLQRIRALSLDLRPSLLDDFGLVPALRWYVERQAGRAALEVSFDAAPLDVRLAPELETACFRIAQEAVTNAVRHANARRLDIALHRSGAELHLTVSDDGRGFDTAAAHERASLGASLGLLGMHERARALGGALSIDSQLGRGTTVRARLPLMLRCPP
ncbi:MAG TPA: PAS domain-containing sensor histidine kinase [Roseiflexaceae bacterium]|nr:PAS domain-containing sensor histidine kinase [Roseiflexaceae bacterium]